MQLCPLIMWQKAQNYMSLQSLGSSFLLLAGLEIWGSKKVVFRLQKTMKTENHPTVPSPHILMFTVLLITSNSGNMVISEMPCWHTKLQSFRDPTKIIGKYSCLSELIFQSACWKPGQILKDSKLPKSHFQKWCRCLAAQASGNWKSHWLSIRLNLLNSYVTSENQKWFIIRQIYSKLHKVISCLHLGVISVNIKASKRKL